MNSVNLIQIFLAFLEGFVLIISPCILPLLPVFLAGSLEGSKKRPIGIVIGFILTFAIFTFFAKKLVQLFGIDLTLIRNISFGILILLGVLMISDFLSLQFAKSTETFISSLKIPYTTKKGFFGGLLFGSLLGFLWTPCAGPILAAVIVQTVLADTTLMSFLTLISFGIGVSIPTLLIVFLGRSLLQKVSFFRTHAVLIRKVLGVILIIGVILMIYADKIIYYLSGEIEETTATLTSSDKFPPKGIIHGVTPYPAPHFENITGWINTMPITLNDLKGKVVLIDFWTYSCINCIRTFPYLKKWAEKYKPYGFEIIGIHTPEFEFEQDINNVKNAVARFNLPYPVLLDNHYSTWRNYQNHYWPASYLINKEGMVVYTHFGEGNYDITEENIRRLLGISDVEQNKLKTREEDNKKETNNVSENIKNISLTPEIYLGYERSNALTDSQVSSNYQNKPMKYTLPDVLLKNTWALQGNWTILSDHILANSLKATIKLHFHAAKVYAVMGSKNQTPIKVTIMINNEKKEILVKDFKLYELFQSNDTVETTLELISNEPNLEVFTFTFGSNGVK